MIQSQEVEAFLSGHRIAVVGASDDAKNFGRTVVGALRDHGYDVVAVHPNATGTVAGAPCYADLGAVPGELDGALIMVHRDQSAAIVAQCATRGIRTVWLFKGIGGAGALSPEAVARCEEHGISVVAGACPLMFLPPVGAVHRVHRAFRRFNHSIARPLAASRAAGGSGEDVSC